MSARLLTGLLLRIGHVPGMRVEKDVTEILEEAGVKLSGLKSLILIGESLSCCFWSSHRSDGFEVRHFDHCNLRAASNQPNHSLMAQVATFRHCHPTSTSSSASIVSYLLLQHRLTFTRARIQGRLPGYRKSALPDNAHCLNH